MISLATSEKYATLESCGETGIFFSVIKARSTALRRLQVMSGSWEADCDDEIPTLVATGFDAAYPAERNGS